MKCFLHIGTEKTGTKSLQNFLNLNRDNLFQNNIIFTKSAGLINNLKLAIAAYDPDRRDGLTISTGISKTGNNLEEFQLKTIDHLSREIAELTRNTNEQRIIFSSEHFQSRLTRMTEIQRLKDILLGFGLSEIKVIVYLRNPAEIANALFSTAIKSGHLLKQPPWPENPYFNNVCNHRNTLEKFTSVFGEDSIIPRIYHRSDLKNGSVIDDFMEVTTIPWKEWYILPERKNESLSTTGINILRRVNEMIPRIIDDKINPLRSGLVAFFEKHFSDTKYLMPLVLFEKYNDAFQDSNEWVRSKYFPHKVTLFPHEPYPEQSSLNMNEEDLNRIAVMIAELWLERQNQGLRG